MNLKRPACVTCNRGYRTKEIGVDCLEMDDEHNPIGIWHADRLECPNCGAQIMWGWGAGPLYTPLHEKFLERARECEYRFRA